jgi:type VI secretion system secreted protein VgrG
MTATTDRNRFLKFQNPLNDKLIVHHFSGHEGLSSLFEFHLDLLSEDNDIDFDQILGAAVTVEMETEDPNEPRYFDGYITEFRYVGGLSHFTRYQATMKPWLWFLSRTSDCRIYQNMKVVDIIKDVFADHGFSDHETRLSGVYQEWEYCVQYRETDLNFVSRLMEQEGIYYYFKHENMKHILVLADGIDSHDTNTGYETIKFFPPTENGIREEDHIHDWAMGREIIPHEVVLKDYDFKKPKVDLTSIKKDNFGHLYPGLGRQIFDYPGEYSEKTAGEEYAKARMAELYTRYHRARGIGNTRGIAAGYLFTLSQFDRQDQNEKYLILSMAHEIKNDAAVTTGATGGEISYQCQFEVMPSTTQYRSPRITPKPIVQGPQTALVVGPTGQSSDQNRGSAPPKEEIYCDEYGRIKVQFHWDRLGQKDQNSSCYVRVSTAWAGKNWGSIHIPRVGHEVVVSFLEGDPDRPLVTGSVYNAENMPPYTLAENKTQSGIKSRSTKEGTDKNFNEIRFEDEKNKEEFRLQAEKHMNVGVKHVRKTFIGAKLAELDRTKVLDDTNPVEGERSDVCPPVGTMNEQLTVFADRETFIKGNDTLQIAEDGSAEKGRCMTVHNGNHELTVKQGDQKTTIDTGNKETTVKTGNQTTTVKTGNQTTDIDTGNQTTTIKLGDFTLDVKAGKITIKAATAIKLKVGQSSIKMDPMSITLKSPTITVDASMNLTAKGGIGATLQGGASTTIKGGIVTIN